MCYNCVNTEWCLERIASVRLVCASVRDDSIGTCFGLASVGNFSLFVPIRLKPVHKVEGMTNGTAAGAGQQQQQQQGSGTVDISTQVQQYQQFLGELVEQ